MRVLAVILLAACVAVNAYSMDADTKNQLIFVYNLNANLYGNIVGLFSDLEEKTIDADRAAGKIAEWTDSYRKQTESAPSEARKIQELMTELLQASKEAVHDYEPANVRTKDALAALEKIKTELKQAMKDIEYMVK